MNRFEQLFDYAESSQPDVILEVGTWTGQTGRQLLLASKAKKYIGFDLWEEGSDEIDDAELNVKKRCSIDDARKPLNIEGVEIELIQGNTRETLPAFCKANPPKIDLALIDGGHSVGTIKNDLQWIIGLMKPRGVIFMDDYYFGVLRGDVGAQNVLGQFSFPFSVLPKADALYGPLKGGLVKMVRINMSDVPRNTWDETKTSAWRFDPEAA